MPTAHEEEASVGDPSYGHTSKLAVDGDYTTFSSSGSSQSSWQVDFIHKVYIDRIILHLHPDDVEKQVYTSVGVYVLKSGSEIACQTFSKISKIVQVVRCQEMTNRVTNKVFIRKSSGSNLRLMEVEVFGDYIAIGKSNVSWAVSK